MVDCPDWVPLQIRTSCFELNKQNAIFIYSLIVHLLGFGFYLLSTHENIDIK